MIIFNYVARKLLQIGSPMNHKGGPVWNSCFASRLFQVVINSGRHGEICVSLFLCLEINMYQIRKDLKTHFRIGHSPDDSFQSTYDWVNAVFLDKMVYVTGYLYLDGIWYLGFHLA